ncbi:MAG: hypothetical protein CBD95_006015 [Flavobacteriales bacterium TMED235]|nr:MAG: hypothetical protein CBD95_006015 [Flavobacteriales bacterium TMED235]
MKFCAIILNRNLPKITDRLYKNLAKCNKGLDIFVVEASDDKKRFSKYVTWEANWSGVKKKGARYYRGMNFALSNLYKEKKFYKYDAYILLANDSIFFNYKIIDKLERIFKKHKKIGILSPCSKDWGEYKILDNKEKIKYFWNIHSSVYVVRTSFIDQIKNISNSGYKNFFFDGSNFRGYGLDSEIIMKAYSNNWSAAITKNILFQEDENLLIKNFEKIKTEEIGVNTKLFIQEGFDWMKKKYGFESKWSMQMFVKYFYDAFFENNPILDKYKL